jgi:5-methylcytosine-specific restriction endonuclease McrA
VKRSPLRRTVMKRKPSAKSVIPANVREEVLARSNGFCEINHPNCPGPARHMHHILMRSHGGKHEASNLLHLCHSAHLEVHSNPAVSYEQGWLQRSEGINK